MRREEMRPLAEDVSSNSEAKAQALRLPIFQIFILFYIQLAEPITASVIYPFVNDAIRRVGITGGDESKTGFYAGLIESSFYLTECLLILHWGRLSDKRGRRPILTFGLFGLTLSMLIFGLSRSFLGLLIGRCMAGLLNGNVGVVKSALAEILDIDGLEERTKVRVIGFVPVVWCLGSTLGPLLGGVLTDPAAHWPSHFDSNFWRNYPYFLPCAAAAMISASAMVLSGIFFKETLRRTRSGSSDNEYDYTKLESSGEDDEKEDIELSSALARSSQGNIALPSSVDESKDSPSEPSVPAQNPTLRSLLKGPILIAIMNYGLLALLDSFFLVLQPLMYSSPVILSAPSNGSNKLPNRSINSPRLTFLPRPGYGLDLTPHTIGIILSAYGLVNVLVQTLLFPVFQAWLGTRRLYIAAMATYAPCFGLFGVMAVAEYWRRVRIGADVALEGALGDLGIEVVLLLIAQLILYYMATMAYGCIFILITTHTPSRNLLGTTNGLAQTTASLARALGPTVVSGLFVISVRTGFLGGSLVYLVAGAVGLCATGLGVMLPRGEIEGRK